jgi:YD repeat-containing protein
MPTGDQAAAVLPTSYERAVVLYLDANARQTNTAAPGGGIHTIWYDQYGTTTQELTAGNRQRALDAYTGDTPAQEATLALDVSTVSVYSADGQRLLESMSPMHDIQLTNGTPVRARAHTSYTYDQGAPAQGGPFNLITAETVSAKYWNTSTGNWTYADPRTTTTEYDWTAKRPIKSTTDPGGLALTSRTSYDSQGRVISQTTPGGGTSDDTPSTRVTAYYGAGANSSYPQCGARPEWEGLTCLTGPGGQPATGPELPTTTTTYDMFGQPATITESTSAGTLRTTTIVYDPAGRAWTTAVSAPGLGTPLETRRNVYDQTTGQLTRTQTIGPGGAVSAEVVRGHDALGRLSFYTDADANTAITTYDLLGRPATVNDGKASRTYTYDQGSERRGLATAVSDSNLGTFTGAYDADGYLVDQTWPNGVQIQTTINQTGQAISLTYTQPGCPSGNCTLF